MHGDDLGPIRDKLATFLIGWMGGPRMYGERYGRVPVPVAHLPFDIGPEDRDAWLACMSDALADAPVSDEMRERLMDSFSQMARMCQTRGPR